MSKPILYRYDLSIWAAIAELAVIETGLANEIQQESLNVIEGKNLELEHVKLNETATIPSLFMPDGKIYDSSDRVVDYLINHAAQGVKVGKDGDPKLVELIHSAEIDPNVFFIGARNDEELKAKSASVPGAYLRARQSVLERVAPTAPPELKDFYERRLKTNGGLVAAFTPGASDDIKEPLFKFSQNNWDAVAQFMIQTLPQYLPESGFIGGEEPGRTDFFAGAYVARIAAVLGAKNEKDGWKAFEALGGGVPAKLQSYWGAWCSRESWLVVYKGGLH